MLLNQSWGGTCPCCSSPSSRASDHDNIIRFRYLLIGRDLGGRTGGVAPPPQKKREVEGTELLGPISPVFCKHKHICWLFNRLTKRLTDRVTTPFIPSTPSPPADRAYNLRQRKHNRRLITKSSALSENNFIIRLLYRDIYWRTCCINVCSFLFKRSYKSFSIDIRWSHYISFSCKPVRYVTRYLINSTLLYHSIIAAVLTQWLQKILCRF